MRLDQGKLKEIQVRLFLSSRAEMQEVIETARQTTMSLMQMQRPAAVQPTIVAPAAVLTPQSPPQAALAAAAAAAAMQTNTMLPSKMPPTLPVQMPGLITQQMYQQQMQHLQQVNTLAILSLFNTQREKRREKQVKNPLYFTYSKLV